MADILYRDFVAQNSQELSSAPSGPHMINLAREAVRDICKSVHVLRNRQEFDWSDEGEYILDHTGYTMVEIYSIWLDHITDGCRLDSTFQENLELRNDTSVWRLDQPEQWYAKPQKVFVAFTYMPKVTSAGFPEELYEQHERLLRLGFLRNVGSYIRLHNGRQAVNQWEALFREELANERARISQGLGPEFVRPFYGGYEDMNNNWS